MTIYQRQYNKVLAQEILRYMLLGRLPDLNQVSSRVAIALDTGSITYKYISQPSRSVFQNQTYNKAMRRLKFDIDTLHEEVIDLIGKASERMTYADLFHKVNSYQLTELESKLNALLFTIQNADYYFLGASESFTDTSKLDRTASTDSIINLSEGCIALPYGGKNTQKISAKHLYNSVNWPITTPNNTIRSSLVPGTSFGNMFSDTVSAWAYEVVSSSAGETTIEFTFPLAGPANQEVEVLANRIELVSHSPTPQLVKIWTSNDGINFIAPIGYEEGISLDDQKFTYAMDFETTLVQYIKVRLSKSTPDKELIEGNTKLNQYLFGLRTISAFTVGRLSKGRYQSKPFDFTEEQEKISKVSIESESIIPQGCSINYSIALTNESNELVTSFVPIAPSNQENIPVGVSKVVQFNTTLDNSVNLTVPTSGDDSAQTYGRPFQGKNFYRIGPEITPKPIFNSSKLYRGFRSWYRDSTQGFELTNVSDIYVSFEQSDVENVYTYTTESVIPTNLVGGNRRVTLAVSKPVYYNSSRGHLLKPPAGITNVAADIKPNYAISKITLTGPVTRRTKPFTLISQRTQYLPATNFVLKSVSAGDLPVLKAASGQIYRLNTDYEILTDEINGREVPDGRFSIPDGSALLNAAGSVIAGLQMEFVYNNDPDITYKISAIQDNFITVVNLLTSYEDNIEVTYRYTPTAPSQIIKASIRVSDSPTTSSNRKFYVEGRDYVVSALDGGIQRIPTGTISNHGNVYVEYTFRDATLGIETFVTWCNITDSSGVQIRFEVDSSTKKNKLIPDTEVGEGFYVNSSQGLVNITNTITTPILGPGWVQFIVRSKNPSTNSTFRDNLINQVIQIRDENNKKVFRDNNLYFKQMVALRDPLKEITLNHLKVNTLKSDHSVFAIDNTTDPTTSYLVLNFNPNTTEELFLYGPTVDTDNVSNPAAISEEFLYTWSTKLESGNTGTKVVVRIDLERDQQSDGALTPKVFDYKLRASI